MRFAPKPENDFAHYIQTYYDECHSRFSKIEAIAGKWAFRDLIPGMSDFDTRFIVSDDMTDSDWCEMSDAVGDAHLALCRRYPFWSRNLEHLPGLNLTWSEFVDERFYYPEYKQWSFYHSATPKRLSESLDAIFARSWDIKDEYFHLKKFCLYYGRYNRSIDPAINLGVHENKYPLHSRIMHYFLPPLQSALILLRKENIAGKFEAIESGSKLFPQLECWDVINEILNGNYETEKWYQEPLVSQFEDMLEVALEFLARELRGVVTIPPVEAGVEVEEWNTALKNVPIDPAMKIFDHAKFARLMKGRLKFYANAPAHFDFTWLINNELNRMGNNFFTVPFSTFCSLKSGKEVNTTEKLLEILEDHVSVEEFKALKAFAYIIFKPIENGDENARAIDIAEIFDPFYMTLSKITKQAHKLSGDS